MGQFQHCFGKSGHANQQSLTVITICSNITRAYMQTHIHLHTVCTHTHTNHSQVDLFSHILVKQNESLVLFKPAT